MGLRTFKALQTHFFCWSLYNCSQYIFTYAELILLLAFPLFMFLRSRNERKKELDKCNFMQDSEVEVILSPQNSVSKNTIQLVPPKLYIKKYQTQFKILIISNIVALLTIIYIGFFRFDLNYIWMIDSSHDRFNLKSFCVSSIIHSILLCWLLLLWTKYAYQIILIMN